MSLMLIDIFPKTTKQNITKLLIDDGSMHYISTWNVAEKISHIIYEHLKQYDINPHNAVITDATAGVGGNTLSFCSYFSHIHAIEKDEQRFFYLQNNISLYNYTNITYHGGDCLDILPSITDHDVVYLDPPWGGVLYKTKEKLRLTLSQMPIEQCCSNILSSKMKKNPKFIVLKLPRNYDISTFKNMTQKYTIYIYKLQKMNIFVIAT